MEELWVACVCLRAFFDNYTEDASGEIRQEKECKGTLSYNLTVTTLKLYKRILVKRISHLGLNFASLNFTSTILFEGYLNFTLRLNFENCGN